MGLEEVRPLDGPNRETIEMVTDSSHYNTMAKYTMQILIFLPPVTVKSRWQAQKAN